MCLFAIVCRKAINNNTNKKAGHKQTGFFNLINYVLAKIWHQHRGYFYSFSALMIL
jgi:hypothetical protein